MSAPNDSTDQPLTAEDAARLRGMYDMLAPDQKEWAKQKLTAYQQQLDASPPQWTEADVKAYEANEARAHGLLTDFDNTVLNDQPSDYRHWYNALPEDQRKAERVSRASRFFVELITQRPL